MVIFVVYGQWYIRKYIFGNSVFESNSGLKIYVHAKYYETYVDAANNSVSSGNVSQFNWSAYAKNIVPLYLLEE